MPSEGDARRSLVLVVLAIAATGAAVLWATRTPVPANSDRYDYLGRAHHLTEGEGPRAMVVYPLRFAFDGSDRVPPENATRPPLWPALIAPALRLGAADTAGVWMAALGLLTLLPLVALAGDRSFGPGAGAFAALALAASFATVRALWGGGPEIWIALLLVFVWTWNATEAGRTGWLLLGLALALMPWLHPIGWLYAGLGWLSRWGRTSRAGLAVTGVLAVAGGSIWYVEAGRMIGTPLQVLQSQAELAKSLFDAGGLGPYRTLDPVPNASVITEHTGAWLYHWAWNLKEQALHLDGWLAWPLVVLALVGIGRDPRLAARDAVLGLVAFAAVGTVAHDPRLLVPVLPVACIWAGAGFLRLVEWRPAWVGIPVGLVAVLLPWLVPLGATPRPGSEIAGASAAVVDPPHAAVAAMGEAGTRTAPVFTDAAVLAWRARRPAVFVPRDPAVLAALRAHPALRRTDAMVLLLGTDGPWIGPEWNEWLDARPVEDRGPVRIVGLDPLRAERATPPADTVHVPAPLALTAADVPDSLVELPAPPASREGLRVTPPTARALERLVAAARDDGIELRIISAYRSYGRQRRLYERAIERHGPDQRWVAAPGTSEHQLGTTVDFADAALAHAVEPSFGDTREGRWLARRAEEFGFVQSYTEANQDRTGYRPEPWHYRHRPDSAGDARR